MASVGKAQAAGSERALGVLQAESAGNRVAAGAEQDGRGGGVGLREEAATLAAEEAVATDGTCQVGGKRVCDVQRRRHEARARE